eukprot:CAMPEP_0203763086 /NCGR_PEP_ID=MMETSP0098-20131031/15782_1 /ASSEMBLY_ACC=CAM_ASM_000208 /TAXON_ID=96639 /ORGANISM=" , Strain NY0313808BC1" /LENGTH=585 /DNA_ID=CAMNT_0050657689 /DNA_START=345 /DNA_END=2099 /DNA_ORIENTATION=-
MSRPTLSSVNNELWEWAVSSKELATFLPQGWNERGKRGRSVLEELFIGDGCHVLSGLILRCSYRYLFELMTIDTPPIQRYDPRGCELGDFGQLGTDSIALILEFCGEFTISRSIAPSCVGFRLFVASREFLCHLYGVPFVQTLNCLFEHSTNDETSSRNIRQGIIQANYPELMLYFDRFTSYVPGLNVSARSLQLVNATKSLMACLETRSQLVSIETKLDELIRSCDVIRASTLLPSLLHHVQKFAFGLQSRESGPFTYESLVQLRNGYSRYHRDFTFLHQVIRFWLRENSNVSKEELLQVDWALRVCSEIYDIERVGGPPPRAFTTIHESRHAIMKTICNMNEAKIYMNEASAGYSDFYERLESTYVNQVGKMKYNLSRCTAAANSMNVLCEYLALPCSGLGIAPLSEWFSQCVQIILSRDLLSQLYSYVSEQISESRSDQRENFRTRRWNVKSMMSINIDDTIWARDRQAEPVAEEDILETKEIFRCGLPKQNSRHNALPHHDIPRLASLHRRYSSSRRLFEETPSSPPTIQKYSLQELLELKQSDQLDSSFDRSSLERHLSADDFQQLFQVSPEQFYSLPMW